MPKNSPIDLLDADRPSQWSRISSNYVADAQHISAVLRVYPNAAGTESCMYLEAAVNPDTCQLPANLK